ncbi:hypothetical protein V6N13_050682 [Hibiscus sabdariffa]|uniref:Uncharacterized protein n=1 Tax=Hibiscus sabdariffa TaxID=183260 RepID=A0ABR2PIF2_9ROSI
MLGGINVFQHNSNLTSAVPTALLPELIGISSDLYVPTALPHHNNVDAGLCGINGTIQKFGDRYQLQDVYEFGEECTGSVHQDFKTVDPTLGQNRRIQGNRIRAAMEDINLKVGRVFVVNVLQFIDDGALVEEMIKIYNDLGIKYHLHSIDIYACSTPHVASD